MTRNLGIFSGSSHPELAASIADRLGVPLGKSTLSKFSNKETNVSIGESVRDVDVYIVQTASGHVNDNFIELLIMIAACRTASARKITAVIPCFPYARDQSQPLKVNEPVNSHVIKIPSKPVISSLEPQSPLRANPISPMRKRFSSISVSQPNISVTELGPSPNPDPAPVIKNNNTVAYKNWTARSGTLIANMLMAAGADHIITMDLHDPQYQGFFDVPVDNLMSQPLIIKYIKDKIPNFRDAVVVSPDAGGAKRATQIADKLNVDFALVHKEHKHSRSGVDSNMVIVGDVTGKLCIIIDDIADTCRTLTSASKLLTLKGATRIVAFITHGILSGNSLQHLQDSDIDEVIVSNSVAQGSNMKKCSKVKVMDITPIFAEAIRRIHNGESVSFLFESVPY